MSDKFPGRRRCVVFQACARLTRETMLLQVLPCVRLNASNFFTFAPKGCFSDQASQDVFFFDPTWFIARSLVSKNDFNLRNLVPPMPFSTYSSCGPTTTSIPFKPLISFPQHSPRRGRRRNRLLRRRSSSHFLGCCGRRPLKASTSVT